MPRVLVILEDEKMYSAKIAKCHVINFENILLKELINISLYHQGLLTCNQVKDK